MNGVRFTPWVGNGFGRGYNGKKIMILGESHYCDECGSGGCSKSECSITKDVINDYLRYRRGIGSHSPWMNTFTRFTDVFLGRKCNDGTTIEFWNSVIFYNYVQEAVMAERGIVARSSPPTEQMFKDSESAFFRVINEYNPDIIFVWGKRLLGNLTYYVRNGYWGSEYILDSQGGKFFYIKGNTKNIPSYGHAHPSAYGHFKNSWSPYLQKAFELA